MTVKRKHSIDFLVADDQQFVYTSVGCGAVTPPPFKRTRHISPLSSFTNFTSISLQHVANETNAPRTPPPPPPSLLSKFNLSYTPSISYTTPITTTTPPPPTSPYSPVTPPPPLTLPRLALRCTQCTYIGTSLTDIEHHIHHIHRTKPYGCPICGRCFGEKGNMNKHLRTVHLKQRRHKCTQCGRAFAFADGLNRHIAMVHLDRRPFECRHCMCETGKHGNDVECTRICGMRFKQKSHHRRHIRSVHLE